MPLSASRSGAGAASSTTRSIVRRGGLPLRLLDPLVFCQSGHVALLVGLVLLLAGIPGRFRQWLLGLDLLHHVFMFPVFRLVYDILGARLAIRRLVSRWATW